MFGAAIELFLGEPLIEFTQDDEVIEFMTITGTLGTMEMNDYSGNWDIWIGDEVVYEVESELVPLMNHTNDKQLFDLYEYAKSLDCDLKYKSRRFVDYVQGAIEKLLITGNLPLTGRSTIGNYEVIYTDTRKFLISLN